MLYNLGEKRREELENLSDQMKELETVCVTEREKWTALQKVEKACTDIESVHIDI